MGHSSPSYPPVSGRAVTESADKDKAQGAGAARSAARQVAALGRRYEDFLRASVDWLWETDAGLTLTYVSSPVALKLGIPAQALIGRPLMSLGHFAEAGPAEGQAAEAIGRRHPFRDAEFVMRSADKRELTYRFCGVPYFADDSGDFLGYRGTARLVSRSEATQEPGVEHQREHDALISALEEALLRNQELAWQLAQGGETGQQSMARKQRLAQAAHELRTPLNAVVGYADLGLKSVFGEVNARYLDCFRTIREAGRHLDKLVGQIESMARRPEARQLSREAVEIGATIARAKAIVALAARSGKVDISKVDSNVEVTILGDPLACAQILVNLLSNAIKFTPAGGSVGITTSIDPAKGLLLTVWDTGIGISEEEQGRIFGTAYRVQGDQTATIPGSGLGLGIARELARAMGGDVVVSSEPGRGSRFTLSLPLSTPAGGPQA